MMWLLDVLAAWIGGAVAERTVVRRRQRSASQRGRFIALRESRIAKWLEGEVAVTRGRIDFTWHDVPRTESYDVLGFEDLGAGPRILDGETTIVAVSTGSGRVLFAILNRDVDRVLAMLSGS